MVRVKGSRCDGDSPFDLNINEETILGRSRGSRIPLASLYISRQHCKLDKTGDQWFVTDLKSFNGTYLNETRLEPHRRTPIQFGDTIRLSLPVQGNQCCFEFKVLADTVQDNLVDSTQSSDQGKVKIEAAPERPELSCYSQGDDAIMINSEDEEEFFPQADASQARPLSDEEDEFKAIKRELKELRDISDHQHEDRPDVKEKDEPEKIVAPMKDSDVALMTDDDNDDRIDFIVIDEVSPEGVREQEKLADNLEKLMEKRSQTLKDQEKAKLHENNRKTIAQNKHTTNEKIIDKSNSTKSSTSKPEVDRKKDPLMTDDDSEDDIRVNRAPKRNRQKTSLSKSDQNFTKSSLKSPSASISSSSSSSSNKKARASISPKVVSDDEDEILLPVPRTCPINRSASPSVSRPSGSSSSIAKKSFVLGKVPTIEARPLPRAKGFVSSNMPNALKQIRARQESKNPEKTSEYVNKLRKQQLIKRIAQNAKASSSSKNNTLKKQVAASFGNRIPCPGGGSANVPAKISKPDITVLSTKPAPKSKGPKQVQVKEEPVDDVEEIDLNSKKISKIVREKHDADKNVLLTEPHSKRQPAPVSSSNRSNRMTSLVESIIAAQKNNNLVKPGGSKSTNDESKESKKRDTQAGDPLASTSSSNNALDRPENFKSTTKRTVNDVPNIKVPQPVKKVKVCEADFEISQVIADKRSKHDNIPISPMKPLGPPPIATKKPLGTIQPTSSVLQNQISLLPKEINLKTFSADGVIMKILDWKVQWMRESKTIKNKAPPLTEKPLVKLKLSYSNWKEYYDVYEPLILHEIWSHIMQSYESDKPAEVLMVAVSSYELQDNFLRLDCQTAITAIAFKEQKYICEGELVLVELQMGNGEKRVVFGYIHEMASEDITDRTAISRFYKVPAGHRILLKYHIRVKFRQLKLDQTLLMRVRSIYYLRPMLRNIEALLSLQNSKLCEDILCPRMMTCQMAIPTSLEVTDKNYNESQFKAILATTEAVQRPYTMPKMLMIQGPPGTGKTFTLIGMIKKLFEDWEDSSSPPKILVCAPSNGAIDEISKRLYNVRHCLDKTQWKRRLRLVRVGQPSQMHPIVRKLSLDELVNENLHRAKTDIQRSLQEKIEKMEREVTDKDRQISEFRQKNDKETMAKLNSEIFQLNREIDFHRKQQKCNNEQSLELRKKNLRADILKKADIVLSTLNSCRQSLLEGLYHTDRDPCQFNCVIIDEASQCCEPEILMPLTYTSISKMILIGDPMQLPATVISPVAAEYQYGRSLFERLFQHFGGYKPTSPVLMLDTQYRMHSEICHFPSKRFYDNRLKTPSDLDKRPFPVKPYLILDLKGTSFDASNQRNLVNELEANFVVNLYLAILELCPSSTIGIITPYQGQKRLLASKLDKITNPGTDINTIDGFQGQERDVIIISLVRDFSSKDSGIGFLGSANRLNVAITRARHSLLICASDTSDVNNDLWKGLINDARDRKALLKTSCRSKGGFRNLIARQS